jgi:Raf kinase inhibitor-like YbhB/YbcL family protein
VQACTKRKLFKIGKYHVIMKLLITIIFIILVFSIGCNAENKDMTNQEEIIDKGTPVQEVEVKNMKLTSPAFEHNKDIPSEYSCDGSDTSPELIIGDIPENAKSLVLINDDPDAPVGTWDHWIIFNISPTTTKIDKGKEPVGTPGKNSWGKTGYGGPCPPSGTHRYFFKLYALDIKLDLQEGASKAEIEKAMQGHILEQTELIGLYKRQ